MRRYGYSLGFCCGCAAFGSLFGLGSRQGAGTLVGLTAKTVKITGAEVGVAIGEATGVTAEQVGIGQWPLM